MSSTVSETQIKTSIRCHPSTIMITFIQKPRDSDHECYLKWLRKRKILYTVGWETNLYGHPLQKIKIQNRITV